MTVWYRCGEWINGDVVLPVEDLGVFQGVTAVERLRTYGQQIFRLSDYLARLQRSTAALSINVQAAIESMPETLSELLHRNHNPADVGITILATPGTRTQRQPTLIAHLMPLDHARIDRLRRDGERLVVTSIVQPRAESMPRHVKHRSRIHYYLASQQAHAVDPLAAAVLIDCDGTITETASANILIVKDGCLLSPPIQRILPGVTLQVVREIARDAQLPWREEPLPVIMLEQADEILLTGTGPGIWFGNNRQGPIFDQLSTALNRLTDPAGFSTSQYR